jgi:hypothetical protein
MARAQQAAVPVVGFLSGGVAADPVAGDHYSCRHAYWSACQSKLDVGVRAHNKGRNDSGVGYRA